MLKRNSKERKIWIFRLLRRLTVSQTTPPTIIAIVALVAICRGILSTGSNSVISIIRNVKPPNHSPINRGRAHAKRNRVSESKDIMPALIGVLPNNRMIMMIPTNMRIRRMRFEDLSIMLFHPMNESFYVANGTDTSPSGFSEGVS